MKQDNPEHLSLSTSFLSRIPRSRCVPAVALGAICLAMLVRCSSEPSYNGQPLSVLVQQLEDPNERFLVLYRISEIGPEASAALPRIEELLRTGKDPSERCMAIRAYGSLARGQQEKVGPVLEAVKEKDNDIRACAAGALGKFGKVAVPALIEALSDPNSSVQHSAALGLATIGPDAKDAIPALTELAKKEEHNWVGIMAQNALMNIQGKPGPR